VALFNNLIATMNIENGEPCTVADLPVLKNRIGFIEYPYARDGAPTTVMWPCIWFESVDEARQLCHVKGFSSYSFNSELGLYLIDWETSGKKESPGILCHLLGLEVGTFRVDSIGNSTICQSHSEVKNWIGEGERICENLSSMFDLTLESENKLSQHFVLAIQEIQDVLDANHYIQRRKANPDVTPIPTEIHVQMTPPFNDAKFVSSIAPNEAFSDLWNRLKWLGWNIIAGVGGVLLYVKPGRTALEGVEGDDFLVGTDAMRSFIKSKAPQWVGECMGIEARQLFPESDLGSKRETTVSARREKVKRQHTRKVPYTVSHLPPRSVYIGCGVHQCTRVREIKDQNIVAQLRALRGALDEPDSKGRCTLHYCNAILPPGTRKTDAYKHMRRHYVTCSCLQEKELPPFFRNERKIGNNKK